MANPIFRYINGQEYVYKRLRYISYPPGLDAIISRVEDHFWFPVSVQPDKYPRYERTAPSRAARD